MIAVSITLFCFYEWPLYRKPKRNPINY